MKIVFMGTPDFSATVLKTLCENGYIPELVVSRADKPTGRGLTLTPSPVKKYALSLNIPVETPEKMSDELFFNKLNAINPDLIIVVAYGKIIPERILNLPKYGCINAHASLLPYYRGAAPMQRAIMDGCKETGVTIMKMDKGLDTGDMILKEVTPISNEDTLESIHDRLSIISGDTLIKAIKLFETNNIHLEKQPDNIDSYAKKITPEDEIIDFNLESKLVSCKIRALTPIPYAHFTFNDKIIKVTKAYSIDDIDTTNTVPGQVIKAKKGEIQVACKKGIICITEVFPQNKKRMSVADFINGSKIQPGDILK